LIIVAGRPGALSHPAKATGTLDTSLLSAQIKADAPWPERWPTPLSKPYS